MRTYPRRRHPGTAAILNVVVPGLGLVYLGRWGPALLNVLLYLALQLASGIILVLFVTRFTPPLPLSPMLTFPFAVLVAYVSGRWAMHEAIRLGLDDSPEDGAPGSEPAADAF